MTHSTTTGVFTINRLLTVLGSFLLAGSLAHAQSDDQPFDETAFMTDSGSSPSNSDLTISGRFENQLTTVVPRGPSTTRSAYVYDQTLLRLDLGATLARQIQLVADGVVQVMAGDHQFTLTDIIPAGSVKRGVATDSRVALLAASEESIDNRAYLDNAYLKLPIGRMVITAGKQPLGQGVGYLWNPTDIFDTKKMLDPTYDKEGIVALRLQSPIGKLGGIDLIGAPDDQFRYWGASGRLSLNTKFFQASLAGSISRKSRTDTVHSFDSVLQATMNGQSEKEAFVKQTGYRRLLGGDLVTDIHGVRLWAEGAYNFTSGKLKDWWSIDLGGEYYFPFETHLLVEATHYGAGTAQTNGAYSFNAWTQVLAGERQLLGRDFLFESIDYPVSDFWTIGLSSFQSVSDHSASIVMDGRWAFAEDMELWLLATVGLGEQDDFLSASRFQGWTRVTAWF